MELALLQQLIELRPVEELVEVRRVVDGVAPGDWCPEPKGECQWTFWKGG